MIVTVTATLGRMTNTGAFVNLPLEDSSCMTPITVWTSARRPQPFSQRLLRRSSMWRYFLLLCTRHQHPPLTLRLLQLSSKWRQILWMCNRHQQPPSTQCLLQRPNTWLQFLCPKNFAPTPAVYAAPAGDRVYGARTCARVRDSGTNRGVSQSCCTTYGRFSQKHVHEMLDDALQFWRTAHRLPR